MEESRTKLRIKNLCSSAVISTKCTETNDGDWVGDFRPDRNMQNRFIPVGGSIEAFEDIRGSAEGHFRLRVNFSDKREFSITIHQHFAFGNCARFTYEGHFSVRIYHSRFENGVELTFEDDPVWKRKQDEAKRRDLQEYIDLNKEKTSTSNSKGAQLEANEGACEDKHKESKIIFEKLLQIELNKFQEPEIGHQIKQLMVAAKNDKQFKGSFKIFKSLLKIIDYKHITIKSGIKQDAIRIIKILIERCNRTDKETIEYVENGLINSLNSYLGKIDSTVGESGQNFTILLLGLLKRKLKDQPSSFNLFDILAKISMVNDYPEIMKNILIGLADKPYEEENEMVVNIVLDFLHSNLDNETLNAINKIIARFLKARKKKIPEDLLKKFKTIKLDQQIVLGIKNYCHEIEIKETGKIDGLIIDALIHKRFLDLNCIHDVLIIFRTFLNNGDQHKTLKIFDFVQNILLETNDFKISLLATDFLYCFSAQLPVHLQQLIEIEMKIHAFQKFKSKNLKEMIIKKVEDYLLNGNKISQICFNFIQDTIPNSLAIIHQLVDLNKQKIPDLLIEKIFETAVNQFDNDELVDLVFKLIYNKYITISKSIDFCSSVINLHGNSNQKSVEKAMNYLQKLNKTDSSNVSGDSLKKVEQTICSSKNDLSQSSLLNILDDHMKNGKMDSIDLDDYFIKVQEKIFDKLTDVDVNASIELNKILKQKLDNIENKKKYRILKFLSSTQMLYLDILRYEKTENWIIEFLIQDMVKEEMDIYDEISLSLFLDSVDTLKKYYENDHEILENILNFFRMKQVSHSLTLMEISRFIPFMQNSTFKNIQTIIDNNSAFWKMEIKKEWIIEKLKGFNLTIDYEMERLVNFLSLLDWTVSIFDEILDEIMIDPDLLILHLTIIVINEKLEEKYEAIQALKNQIETNAIKKEIDRIFAQDKADLVQKKAIRLLKHNSSLTMILDLLEHLRLKNYQDVEEYLLRVFDIIYNYDLDPDNCRRSFELIKLVEPRYWEKEVHNLAIKSTFLGGQERSLDELLDIIYSGETSSELIEKERLKEKHENIINRYNNKSKILCNENFIKNWFGDDIEEWSTELKKRDDLKNEKTQNEIIAVVKRAVELHNKFDLRTVQLLSLIVLIDSKQGRLAQINTGEGKSTIVAMLAVIKALEGNTVDVVTTSTELSVPEAKKQAPFFNMFNLSVAENFSGDSSTYKKNIVYGISSNFQRDILKTDYLEENIRDNRAFKVAIVDEVDSMLIDGRLNSVQLSTNMPAMHFLEIVLVVIYSFISDLQRRLISGLEGNEEQVYYVTENFKIEDNKLILVSNKNLNECLIDVDDTKAFIEEHTKDHLRNLLRSLSKEELIEWEEFKSLELKITELQEEIEKLKSENKSTNDLEKKLENISNEANTELAWNKNKRYPFLEIPQHFQEFAVGQIPNWVKSCLDAKFAFKRYMHYDVKGNQIIPIDYMNTGVFQNSLVWSHGLCQFLQIKEDLKLTPETLSTNFISNVEFFKRYKNIYGLTGTLGSLASQKLLQQVYNSDTVIIPPFKSNKIVGNESSKYLCKELPPLISNSQNEWYEAICEENLNKVRNNQGVLIICKFVNEVLKLEERLKAKNQIDQSKIFTYTGERDFKKREIDSGEIIIATNIVGRGCDIKTSDEIERNGGLHVCITFLPINVRIELQNVGRTARKGNNGTAQLIILDENENSMKQLKDKRDKKEVEEIDCAFKEVKKMLLRDDLFKKFCELRKDTFPNLKENKFERRGLEERFAIFLNSVENLIDKIANESDLEEVRNKFKVFSNSIRASKDQVISNPYYNTLKGNEFFHRHRHENAIQEYDESIKKNQNFALNARYNKACAILRKNDGQDSKREAKIELEIAKELIKKYFNPRIITFHSFLLIASPENTKISQQLQNQMSILKQQENYIDDAIEVLKRCLDKNWGVNIEMFYLHRVFEGAETDVSSEIKEAEEDGLFSFFKLTERKPKRWWDFLVLAVIGLGQIIAGAVITVFSFGSATQIGMGLISEGVSDLVQAIKLGIEGGEFDWKEWGIQKGVSMAVSCITAGIGAIKNAIKTVGTAIKTSATKIKVGLTNVAKGNFSNQVTSQFTKKGWKIVSKKIGKEVVEECAKETLNKLSDLTLLEKIEEEIYKKVESEISRLLEDEVFQKAILIDHSNRNNYWQNRFINYGLNLLKKDSNRLTEALKSIADGVLEKSVAQARTKGLSKALQAFKIGKEMEKVSNYLDDFKMNYALIIDQHEQEILHYDLTNESENLDETVNCKSNTINSGPRPELKNDDIQVTDIRNQKQYSSEQSENRSRKPIDTGLYKPSKIESIEIPLTEAITDKMIEIIKSKIIKPIVNMSVNQMASSADKKSFSEIQTFQDRREIKSVSKNIYKNKDKKPKRNELVKNIDPKVSAMANRIRTDGQFGMHHLEGIARSHNIKIEIYKGNKVEMSFNKGSKDSIKIEYTVTNGVGHYSVYKPLNQQDIKSSGKNNCLLDALSYRIKASPTELRRQVAADLEKNHLKYAKIVDKIEKFERNDNSALLLGGARYTGKSEADAKKILDDSQYKKIPDDYQSKTDKKNKLDNSKNEKKSKLGHPRGHLFYYDPAKKGANECVQNYSKNGRKSGFLNENDQNKVAHSVLTKFNNEIDKLNGYLAYEEKKKSFEINRVKFKSEDGVNMEIKSTKDPKGNVKYTDQNDNPVNSSGLKFYYDNGVEIKMKNGSFFDSNNNEVKFNTGKNGSKNYKMINKNSVESLVQIEKTKPTDKNKEPNECLVYKESDPFKINRVEFKTEDGVNMKIKSTKDPNGNIKYTDQNDNQVNRYGVRFFYTNDVEIKMKNGSFFDKDNNEVRFNNGKNGATSYTRIYADGTNGPPIEYKKESKVVINEKQKELIETMNSNTDIRMKVWVDGEPKTEAVTPESYVLVAQHYPTKEDDPLFQLKIQTLYPANENIE